MAFVRSIAGLHHQPCRCLISILKSLSSLLLKFPRFSELSIPHVERENSQMYRWQSHSMQPAAMFSPVSFTLAMDGRTDGRTDKREKGNEKEMLNYFIFLSLFFFLLAGWAPAPCLCAPAGPPFAFQSHRHASVCVCVCASARLFFFLFFGRPRFLSRLEDNRKLLLKERMKNLHICANAHNKTPRQASDSQSVTFRVVFR